jgi:hypothetical protein
VPIFHRVAEGECLQSIAFLYGFFPDTIWNAPENEALVALREHPSVLLPGDDLVIPDRVPRSETVGTGRRHRFRRRGVPATLRVRLGEDGVPKANRPYLLRVDGVERQGVTTADGEVREAISPAAKLAEIVLEPGEDGEQIYTIHLGRLLPVATPGGVRDRLANLGHLLPESLELEGEAAARALRIALRQFQQESDLEVTGVADDATREKRVAAHGY